MNLPSGNDIELSRRMSQKEEGNMKINLEIKKAVVIACAIAIVALSASCGGSGCQGNFTPAPSLGNVTPNTISIAQVPFGTNATFIVNGGNFVQSSVVRVDGMAVATTF